MSNGKKFTLIRKNIQNYSHKNYCTLGSTLVMILILVSFTAPIQSTTNLSIKEKGFIPSKSMVSLTSNGPITINGNNGFTNCGCIVPGGNGTKTNPYIIENFNIASRTIGIEINNTSDYFILENNFLSANSIGIELNNTVNGQLINNTVNNNYLEGIVLASSNNTSVRNNTVIGNYKFNIYVNYSINTFLVNNSFTNAIIGVYIDNSNNSIITNSNLSDNYNSGIYIINSFNTSLMKNLIANDYQSGVSFYSSNNSNIINNIINSNTEYGVYIASRSNNSILTNNIVNNNYMNGIYLTGLSNNNTLINNTAIGSENGFSFNSCSQNYLQNNTANNDTNDGIDLYYSSNNTLDSNTANYNFNYGIMLQGSNNNKLEINLADYNQYDGIYMSNSSYNVLDNNTANFNNNINFYEDSNVNNLTANNFITIPSPPFELQITVFGNQLALTWLDTAEGNNITGYNIYRSNSAGGPYNLIGTTTQVIYKDATVKIGITYYYVVRAVDELGESTNSNEISGIIPVPTTSTKTTSASPGFNNPLITLLESTSFISLGILGITIITVTGIIGSSVFVAFSYVEYMKNKNKNQKINLKFWNYLKDKVTIKKHKTTGKETLSSGIFDKIEQIIDENTEK